MKRSSARHSRTRALKRRHHQPRTSPHYRGYHGVRQQRYTSATGEEPARDRAAPSVWRLAQQVGRSAARVTLCAISECADPAAAPWCAISRTRHGSCFTTSEVSHTVARPTAPQARNDVHTSRDSISHGEVEFDRRVDRVRPRPLSAQFEHTVLDRAGAEFHSAGSAIEESEVSWRFLGQVTISSRPLD